MASSFRFFSLPWELRDMVYEHYFAVAGGYVCDSQSFLRGKLRGSGVFSRRIDLDLIFTCRQVAAETKGLPFRANTITFKTVTSQDLGVLAVDFDFVVHYLEKEQDSLFLCGGHYVTSEAHVELKRRYPQFAPLLDRLRADRGYFGFSLASIPMAKCRRFTASSAGTHSRPCRSATRTHWISCGSLTEALFVH
ncbi:hypothetical protein CH35J_008264 [Colletotrichum higginsianum]|uniref:Uncharacterized protein n=1 Tax=Colletotrichum higginsianum TaxID=80884 RepID=A0A4T0VTH8_9PEZI|nr:hypothetical protein CH35J_008264 [Colletotrichum higginsianum]